MKCISVAPPSSPPHTMGIFFPFCSTVAVCRPCGADLVPRGIDGSHCVCLPETLGCERRPQSAQRLPTREWPAGREQERAVRVLKGHLSLLETSRPYSFSEAAEFRCTALSLSPDREMGQPQRSWGLWLCSPKKTWRWKLTSRYQMLWSKSLLTWASSSSHFSLL